MKRDMDLVRKILMACEASDSGFAPRQLTVEGYPPDQVSYHVMLMDQAGLLKGENLTHSSHTTPEWRVLYLTWAGHEFLEAARNDTTWNKAKGAVAGVGGMAFDVLKTVLIGYATQKANQLLGLAPST
jgi:hypothetical protein